jgi:hypothetical protein
MLISTLVAAQEIQNQDSEHEKIRGARFIAYPSHPGSPFLNDKFLVGEVEFTDGSIQDNIILNYGAYRDELIYYNTAISTQIVIDKKSLNGFSFVDKKGGKRTFRKLYFKGSFKGDCFFEILSKGEISLLAYRKVNLEASDTYYSKTGMAYQPAYTYYLYSPEKGFTAINISKNSLLSLFSKTNQKLIRKTLRKNGVYISDEPGFIKAWELIRDYGIHPEY